MVEDVAVECTIAHETDDAYLIDTGEGEEDNPHEVWVPKQFVDSVETNQRGKISCLYIQEWFALQEGLI